MHTGADPRCRHCAAAVPETAEHALLDCPAYADLRSGLRFAPLFAGLASAPLAPRLRELASQPQQTLLAAFVHACFELRSAASS